VLYESYRSLFIEMETESCDGSGWDVVVDDPVEAEICTIVAYWTAVVAAFELAFS